MLTSGWRKSHRNKWLPLAIVIGVSLGVFFLLESTRGFPFSSTDDGPIYFVPLIKAHTDAWLRGSPGAYLWNLGSGHSVWESGQLGPLYPPYVLANILARVIGEPLLLLEVSAALHLLLAGLFAAWLLPPFYRGVDRGLAAALVAVQPAPIILGANWTPYISSYPWFVALLLLSETSSGEAGWPRSRRLGVFVASLGFLVTAHPQMVAVGLGLVATRSLAGRGDIRMRLQNLKSFVVAQLPAILPMTFIYLASSRATPNWMGGRVQSDFLLREGQSITTVLHGLLLGNLVERSEFVLWEGVSWTGIGVFFAPWLLLSLYSCLRQRRFTWPALVLIMVGLAAIQSFPIFRVLAIGPLYGFRWTWKLAWFLGPVSLLLVLVHMKPTDKSVPIWRTLVAAALVLCSVVGARGMQFDLLPSLRLAQPSGIMTLVEETRQLEQAVGMEPGDRIALLGGYPMSVERLPLALLGLIGNAPVLAGLGSAHLYEPMEPESVSLTHFGLSTPWRRPVPPPLYLEDPERIERSLASIGTRWLITHRSGLLRSSDVQTFVGRDGLPLFVREIPPPIAPWPLGIGAQGPVPVALLGNGDVVTVAPVGEPPDMGIGREVRWSTEDDGRLRGRVRQLSPAWIVGEVLALAVALLALWRFPRGIIHPKPRVQAGSQVPEGGSRRN
jgi:hypothetical protein